jgi:acyl-CoA thioester hydrolase
MAAKKPHSFPIRVYYEDTDAGGIVYYANYLKFAERARTEALRQAGIEQSRLRDAHDIAFVVRRAEIDFLKPARLDDCLTIASRLTDISKVSMQLEQTILRGDEILVKLAVKLAVIGKDLRLAKLPDDIKKAMQRIWK